MARKTQVPARTIVSVDASARTVRVMGKHGFPDDKPVPLSSLTRREIVRAAVVAFPGTMPRAWQHAFPDSDAGIRRAIISGERPASVPVAKKNRAKGNRKVATPTPAPLVPSPAPNGNGQVTRGDVVEIVTNAISAALGNPVPSPALPAPEVPKLSHEILPTIIRILQSGEHCFMVGPAGTGKSTIAEQAADFLGMEYGSISLSPMPMKSQIFGYMDANGKYVSTEFRKRYENGGIFNFDEMDNSNPSDMASVNQALSGGVCAFPDGMVRKHPNFLCVATGNTFGTGADGQYVGRNKLDMATLDRFTFAVVNIDETLEEILAMNACPSNPAAVAEWIKRIRAYRSVARTDALITPRAAIAGGRLIENGFTIAECEQMRVFKNLPESVIVRMRSAYDAVNN